MNKTELVAAMAEQAGISKKDAEAALKAFTDTVSKELKKGGKVQLVHFVFTKRNGIKKKNIIFMWRLSLVMINVHLMLLFNRQLKIIKNIAQ